MWLSGRICAEHAHDPCFRPQPPEEEEEGEGEGEGGGGEAGEGGREEEEIIAATAWYSGTCL